MIKKIFGELEEKILEMAKAGNNANRIAKTVGLREGSIVGWAKRTGIELQKRTGPETIAKKMALIDLLKKGVLITHACKEAGVDFRVGKIIAKESGLDHTIRTRADAAKDKQFTIEEANSRLPDGHGSISHYDSENKEYVIKREDGSTYTRILSQLFRGDPKKGNKVRITEEDATEILVKQGYRLIPGTFRIKREPLQAEHFVCGYVRETILSMFPKQSCPRCSNTGTSKEETGMDDWIKSLGVDSNKFRFEKDYPGKGKAKEIDIFVKESNFGIEYCGLYHHGEKETLHSLDTKMERHQSKGRSYSATSFDSPRLKHKAKMDKANSLGIQLITIFSSEWKNNQDKVKAVLKAKLGKNEIKIYARKTSLREIDKKQSKEFLDLYHLQSSAPSIVRFGLFFEDELVAVITGGHHHRIKGKFILNRLCFKSNVTVVGGSSKLNQALESWAKSQGYAEVISWSDNRWSDGGVYRALGYYLENEIAPDYFYFDNKGNTFSKQSCQKKHLLAKGATGNTEWEMAQSLGYDRIFDCGKKTWVKKLI